MPSSELVIADNEFALPSGVTKLEAYREYHSQLKIAAGDMKNAAIRARFYLFMIFHHSLWKMVIDHDTMLPVYQRFEDWVANESPVRLSTARKYIGQVRMLYAGNFNGLAEADPEVIEYLWSNVEAVDRATGKVLAFKGQEIGKNPDDIINQALTEVGYTLGTENVPDNYKMDALHQLVNPLQPKIWFERKGNTMEFFWRKRSYPEGGDSMATTLEGEFTILWKGEVPPGDVTVQFLRMLKLFT